MKKKLKLFKRLETLKRKDIFKDQQNSNLISKEITKTNSLIKKIDLIISENSQKNTNKSISAAFFKNESKLLGTLNEQRYIAINKKDFLMDQNMIYRFNIAKKTNDKKNINKKYKEELNNYFEELEQKNLINFKKK